MENKRKYVKDLTESEKQQRIKDAIYLKTGDREEIARIAGYTHQAISVYINGRSNNQRIEKVFNHFVAKRKKELVNDLKTI